MLEKDEFVARLAEELSLSPDELGDDVHFGADLGFDSVRNLELLLIIEEFGADVPAEAVVPRRVRDAYRLYRECYRDEGGDPLTGE